MPPGGKGRNRLAQVGEFALALAVAAKNAKRTGGGLLAVNFRGGGGQRALHIQRLQEIEKLADVRQGRRDGGGLHRHLRSMGRDMHAGQVPQGLQRPLLVIIQADNRDFLHSLNHDKSASLSWHFAFAILDLPTELVCWSPM